ncbi:DUF2189 domain-containing protein [Corynebacterium uterequi]|uniref:Integral membrane protein n=1 Tax=Corynebacterium uterequi TaxID=1072256 RepID=A0A0G3HD35_9CORY|nr:hypothetical protein [Corynebacterium uterequi]AKK11281.1 hypothetical protein CUTER_06460 [Corynebacterium uterequi]
MTTPGNDDFTPYPGTNHPEDQPGGLSYGASAAGRLGPDGYANPGYAGSYYGTPGLGDAAAERPVGTGKVHPFKALSWGMSTAFANWRLWILLPLAFILAFAVYGLVNALLSEPAYGEVPTTSPISTWVTSVLAFIGGLFLINALVRQLDRPKVGWRDLVEGINLWPLVGVSLVVGLINGLLGLIFAGAFFKTVFTASSEELKDPAVLQGFFLGIGAYMLVSLVVSPLLVFAPYYVADRQAGVFSAVGKGFKASLRNYFSLLLFYIVVTVGSVLITIITFGIGTIFIYSGFMLAVAYMYREAAELPVGVNARG